MTVSRDSLVVEGISVDSLVKVGIDSGDGGGPGPSFPDWEINFVNDGANLIMSMPSRATPTNFNVRILGETPASVAGNPLFFGQQGPGRVLVGAIGAVFGMATPTTVLAGSTTVVANTRYDLRLEVRGTNYELFVDGNSEVSGASTVPGTMEYWIGMRDSGAVPAQILEGRIFYFAFEDIDTPANTSQWNLTRNSEFIPGDTNIFDQNTSNQLTVTNANVPAWLEVTDSLPTIPPA